MRRLLTLTLLLTLLAACAPVAPPPAPTVKPAYASPTPGPSDWWRQAVFYEIFVRSFADSDGDGIGDFNGIAQKLDYLQELGVTALWLMPIQPSPSYHGYDVTDYYGVNPQYGTLDDFKNLLKAAHERDMRIIIDLVLNHTSAQHPWFVDANTNAQSPYRDWYVWNSTDPGGGHWHKGLGGSYYAYFWDQMPDLNYRNPAVTAEMEKMSAYWLTDIGVDGFRVDAAKHLIEDGNKLENTPATHDWLKGFYTFYKAKSPQAYVVGEVANAGGTLAKTYAGQMDQIFNFEMANAFVNSAGAGAASSANSTIKFAIQDKPDGNYATFLTNHDQNRVMSVLKGDVNKAKVAAALLLTAPGTPFIYYGEEIGMRGVKPDEDIRLPMQWTGDAATAGFSTGTPWRAPHASTVTVNVAVEEKDPDSLFSHYRALIALRKNYSALQSGALAGLETGNPGVYAILRYDANEILLVVINLTGAPVTDYNLSLGEPILSDGAHTPETLFGAGAALPLKVANGQFSGYQPLPALAPFSTLVVQLKK